jgi:hypothetical protein
MSPRGRWRGVAPGSCGGASAGGLTRLSARRRRLVACIPLVLACALAACDELLVPDRPATASAAIFDQVWGDFDRYYAHFNLSGVDWQAARERWRPRAASATGEIQLATALAGLLAELRDPHVTLYTPQFTYQDTRTRPRSARAAPSRR